MLPFRAPSILNKILPGQVLTYPTVEFRCLAVCDVEIKARQVEHKGDTAECSEQLLIGWLLSSRDAV